MSQGVSGDVADCVSSGLEDVGEAAESAGNGRSVQGWGSKNEDAIHLLLLGLDSVREVLELVDLLALDTLVVLLDLALLGRGHGKGRRSRQGGSEESLELHICGVWGIIGMKKNLMRWMLKD